MAVEIWNRFIKKDCRYLDAERYVCRLAETTGTPLFPNKECIDCLVALHRLRVETLREALVEREAMEARAKKLLVIQH